MQPTEFDWYTGKVVHWDLAHLSPNNSLEAQYEELKEDLAQVQFGQFTLLDVGWYPEFSPEGRFVVSVIRHQNWEEPMLRLECKDMPNLYLAIRSAIEVARIA